MQQLQRKQVCSSRGAAQAGRCRQPQRARVVAQLSTGGLQAPSPPPAWPGRVPVPQAKVRDGPKVRAHGGGCCAWQLSS